MADIYGVNRNDGSVKFFVQINDFGSWSPASTMCDYLLLPANCSRTVLRNWEALWSLEIDDGPATSDFTNTAVVVADCIAYVVGTNGFNDVPVAID